MKILFINLLIILIFSSSASAQWYPQFSGVNTNLYSFFSIDGQIAWATGANGVILKTTNSGASWVQKPSSTSYSISFVYFFNPNEGIVAGSGGTIKKSYDGGNTWQSIYGGTYNRLQEGCFVNDSVGYLCGNAGILLKTTDRGNTWTTSVIGPSNFAFIYFVNETTGLATTENTGQIWKTTDAGVTWILKQIIGNYSIWQIHFFDENNGWVVGEYGTIAHTSNGGESWNLQYSGTGVNLRSVYFHTPEIGWVVGKDEKRLRTINGGNNWTHDHTGYTYEYLYIYFYNDNIGWIIGTDGVILFTDNGGLPGVQNFFEKTIGGVNSERGVSLKVTNDNGFVIAGSSESFSNPDMYLIKLDSTATIEWSRVYHSSGSIERLHDVEQTSDGGYYLAGYIEGGFGFLDQSILRVDSQGNLIWAKNFGGYEADELRGISITADGGALVSGYTASFGAGSKDVNVIKFNSNGNVQWAKTFGSLYEDFNTSNIIASDGNIILSGAIDISGSYSIRPTLIKLDTLGNILFAKYFSGYIEDWARDIIETPDGGFLITGETKSYGLGGSQDIYLIKTNSIGDVEWAKSYGGIGSETGYSVVMSSDGNYIIGGYTNSFGFGGYDAFLMKVDLNGSVDWFKTYGGYTNDYAIDVVETPDYGYALTGLRSSNTLGGEDVYLLKTDANGHSSCAFGTFNPNVFTISNLQSISLNLSTMSTTSVSNLTLTTITPNSVENTSCATIPVELKSFSYELQKNDVVLNWLTVTETNNSGFKIFRDETEIGFVPGAGTTAEYREYSFKDENLKTGNYLYALIQIDFDGTNKEIGKLEVNVDNIPSEFLLEQNYPNPFNPMTKIQYSIPQNVFVILSVYNSLGEKVALLEEGMKEAGFYTSNFNGSNLPSGIYFYTLSTDKFISTKKMILLK
jgi:photosystem II stability/assembly factor-like uncharacterized protein